MLLDKDFEFVMEMITSNINVTRSKYMNLYFIILFVTVYSNENLDKLWKYLESPFVFTESNGFSKFLFTLKLNTVDLNNILLSTLLGHYTTWAQECNKVFLSDYKFKVDPLQKYLFIKKVLDNIFLSETHKEEFVLQIGKIQRHYNAINRFVYMWKWKRMEVIVSTDLYLSDIDINKRYSFVLVENNKKYFFHISELMRIIKNSLCQHWEGSFIVMCEYPRNPYTKQKFTLSNLYNLYFHMKYNMNIIIPEIFHLWFMEDFSFISFAKKYTRLLRKTCIKDFVKSVPNTNIMVQEDIQEMIEDNDYTVRWDISKEFPDTKLVDIFRPYLYLYYLINYEGLDDEYNCVCTMILEQALSTFYKYNKKFGRKKIKAPLKFCSDSKRFKWREDERQVQVKPETSFFDDAPSFSCWSV